MLTVGHASAVNGVASGQQHTTLSHDSSVRAVAFSPDGRLLATASYDRTARVWSLFEAHE